MQISWRLDSEADFVAEAQQGRIELEADGIIVQERTFIDFWLRALLEALGSLESGATELSVDVDEPDPVVLAEHRGALNISYGAQSLSTTVRAFEAAVLESARALVGYLRLAVGPEVLAESPTISSIQSLINAHRDVA